MPIALRLNGIVFWQIMADCHLAHKDAKHALAHDIAKEWADEALEEDSDMVLFYSFPCL